MTSRLNKFSIGKKLKSFDFGIIMLCVTKCDVVLKYTMKWTLVNVFFGCFLVYPIMHFISRDPSQLIYAYIVMQVIDVTKTINEVPTITTQEHESMLEIPSQQALVVNVVNHVHST
jgi:hypothetical protein